MTDNQWPRFMVFQQESPEKPLLHNGSVHAADIELALLNARDVFARRPEASLMWVVPADSILTKTREELAADSVIARSPQGDEAISTSDAQSYYVFGKLSEQSQASYLGTVQAGSAGAAMQQALDTFAKHNPIWWWVFPANAVLASEPDDADPMFAPARDKTFKRQAEYPVVTMMRQLHTKGKLDE